ncbi:MAG: [protein-PII] uridylyltransferase [Acidimicrobiales bacterium]
MKRRRQALLDDHTLVGRAWCAAYSRAVDEWLGELFDAAIDAPGSPGAQRVALVAVGGYGRGELSPCSDIDVILLHDGRSDVVPLAERIWYPIWDEGLKLGHSVRTVKDALALAADDLDTATSLLSARHVAGDETLTADLVDAALSQWRKRAKRWLARLARSVDDRHDRAGEVAFLLEPDLKEGRGGLRDAHALGWAGAARAVLFDGDEDAVGAAYTTILDARVELHRRTQRPSDLLALQEQDGVAAALGYHDADELMKAVAGAARTIAWTSDDAWARITSTLRGPLGRLPRRDRAVAPGVLLRDGDVHLAPDARPADDPTLVLRIAVAAAQHHTVIDRHSLERLAVESRPLPDPWPAEGRELLTALLLTGQPAIRVIEALDQRGLWTKVLPEWAHTRSCPQRNSYHRFTVDRHLVEAAAGAAALADRVERPDLLLIGTLVHDLGKGLPGDHTQVGVELVRRLGTRMGFPPVDVDALVALVERHLLLPDVATRRDLDDPSTIELVASAVGDRATLRRLAALTEADSLATGPAAWGPWKAKLVADLVERVDSVLGGSPAEEVVGDEFPSPEHVELMQSGRQVLAGDDDTLTVVTADRPGVFATVAGVLALHGLAVTEAAAYSDDRGVALGRFRVEPSFGPVVPWERVVGDLERAFAGRLALQARLDEKAKTYARRRPQAAVPARTGVTFDNEASATATVVDVLAPDSVGLLHRVTRALADLELDIRSAKVTTIGPQAVDAFYLCDRGGGKLDDPDLRREIERAVLHAVKAAPG